MLYYQLGLRLKIRIPARSSVALTNTERAFSIAELLSQDESGEVSCLKK
jgi:hypothetical protein